MAEKDTTDTTESQDSLETIEGDEGTTIEEESDIEPFVFEEATRAWAVSDLESIMDLIRWSNCTLSEEKNTGEVLTEEVIEAMFADLDEELDSSIFWDYATTVVFNILYLPIEKATMLMYSKLSETERESVVAEFENRITAALEEVDQANKEESSEDSQTEEIEELEKEQVVENT